MILNTKINKGVEVHTKSNKFTMPVGSHDDLLTGKIAIDCEMMRSNIGQVLGRVSVVNYEGDTIFDTFVCYPEPITITNTEEEFSGIDWNDIDPKNGALSFPEVQARLVELLRDRIVIGHDIQKDLKVISMDLPSHILRLQGVALRLTPVTFDITVRDTQKCRRYLQYANRGAHQGPSLKNLALEVLGRPIKQSRVSSVEDAIATMEIYRNAEADIEQEQGR
jgi:RNA exonuclease 4